MNPALSTDHPPLILLEDEHLLAVNKPAGWNTHAPDPYAGEGIYDWLRHRQPAWEHLAIIHRLDKDTSGVLLFSKSTLANRSLSQQFSSHTVLKKYLFLTDRTPAWETFVLESALVRSGDRYLSRPPHAGGSMALTRFRVLERVGSRTLLEAEPVTGRTHQIRVHASEAGCPVMGDELYGGSAGARVFLHAHRLSILHPATQARLDLVVPSDFEAEPHWSLRQGLMDPSQSNVCRLLHGASDGWPGWYLDRLDAFLLSSADGELNAAQGKFLSTVRELTGGRGVYHKVLTRQVRTHSTAQAGPRKAFGEDAPARFVIRENGLQFELSLEEGYSFGLFLDQRDNRRRLLTNHAGAQFSVFPGAADSCEVLNTFAYTCAFSVCAARAGARVTSIDLSRKYLDWGRRNFELNGLPSADHDFLRGDVMDWLRRLAKRKRTFEVILLDPPTFSRSKESGTFQAEKDYGALVSLALPLLKPGGVLFASSNTTKLNPAEFLGVVAASIRAAGRDVLQQRYFPQPPDFPVSRAEPAYLKTVWLRVS